MTKLEEELLRFRLSTRKKEECDQLPQASTSTSISSTSTSSSTLSSSLPVLKDKIKCLDESKTIKSPIIEQEEIVPSTSSSTTTTATTNNTNVTTINTIFNTRSNTDNLVSEFARDFYASGYNYGHYNNYDFDYNQFDFDNIGGDDEYGWEDEEYIEEEEEDEFIWTRKDIFSMICKALFYLVLQAIAFMHEFGAVFFIISLLIFICTNLSDRPRLEGEPSAYSVFNDDFEPIQGTVDAATLQNQLFFGSLWF
ncbi:SAYSVFN motif domain containing 1 [Brevipalpus obovatus]|uniref:SAYSVFN motif domain containing 1 n=1 Tax=Brevipalpus obovatus TaxID=246614 RepID=UPI003D9E64EE